MSLSRLGWLACLEGVIFASLQDEKICYNMACSVTNAFIAQVVERSLGKTEVSGPSPEGSSRVQCGL